MLDKVYSEEYSAFTMAEDTNFEASVSTRCTEDLKRELERLADEESRTVANYVRLVLERHVEEVKKSR